MTTLQFSYTGKSADGQVIQGTIEGHTEQSVAQQLIQTGITPLTISLSQKDKSKWQVLLQQFQLGLPSLKDLLILSRQLYTLTRAGVPILRAINIVKENSKNEKLKDALKSVVSDVEAGKTLATALSRHNLIFPEFMVALVNIGENTGSLDKVLLQTSLHFEREIETRKRISTATRYPVMVIGTIILAIVIINTMVIPTITGFFQKFNSALPLPTRIIIAASDFTVHYWYLLLLISIGLVGAFFMFIQTEEGRLVFDKKQLTFPVIGNIINETLLGRFAYTFALSLRAGMPLIEALKIVGQSIGNKHIAHRISTIRSGIERGESLIIAATESQMFSSMMLQMLAIGEEVGELDRLLEEIANYYALEVEYDIKRLSDSIEPILISVIAGIVLILALGVFLPMWNLSQVMMGKSGI